MMIVQCERCGACHRFGGPPFDVEAIRWETRGEHLVCVGCAKVEQLQAEKELLVADSNKWKEIIDDYCWLVREGEKRLGPHWRTATEAAIKAARADKSAGASQTSMGDDPNDEYYWLTMPGITVQRNVECEPFAPYDAVTWNGMDKEYWFPVGLTAYQINRIVMQCLLEAGRRGEERGVAQAKAELREWLGLKEG